MTPSELQKAKHRLFQQGLTIDGWAKANGFPPAPVYRVLNGVDKARRGRAHEIAVKLGLKPNPEQLAA